MIRKLTSKKGISPILATLLLIAIAVAAAIISYAWIITFVSTRTEQSGALLVRENVRFYDSGNTTDITIRNTGTANAKIATVYWSESSLTNLVKLVQTIDYTFVEGTNIVRADNSITIRVNWGQGGTISSVWQSGETYYFKIVTSTGEQLPLAEKA